MPINMQDLLRQQSMVGQQGGGMMAERMAPMQPQGESAFPQQLGQQLPQQDPGAGYLRRKKMMELARIYNVSVPAEGVQNV